MYRVMIESVLGLQILKGDTLQVDPLILPEWKRYSITIQRRDGKTQYKVEVLNSNKESDGLLSASLDGEEVKIKKNIVKIKMNNDGASHHLKIKVKGSP